jgi:hypothetical protein
LDQREIYHSPNGDHWLLARMIATPAGCSCGTSLTCLPADKRSILRWGAFLVAVGNGLEKQELLRLATLVRDPPATTS